MPDFSSAMVTNAFTNSEIVSVGFSQTILQANLQNPMLVANALTMASTIPSSSQTLAELGVETIQPILYERKQTVTTDKECK